MRKHLLLMLTLLLLSLCCAHLEETRRVSLTQASASTSSDALAQFQPEVVVDAGAQEDSGAKHRIVHVRFDSPVTFASVLGFDQMMATALRRNPEVLVIEIRTLGGSMEAGFSMVKSIEDIPVPTVCVADGLVASEGVFLLQACDIRLMTDRSTLMVHEPYIEGRIDRDVDLLIDQQQKFTYAWTQFVARRWKISPADLRKILRKKDLWLTEKDAAALGAVDATVPSVTQLVGGLVEEGRLPPGLIVPH